MGETYRLNEAQVACENLEGDLILVHFETGLYYNIRGIGSDICQYLMTGGSIERVIADLVQRFGMAESEVESDVRAFVEILAKDGLIVRRESTVDAGPMKISAVGYEPARAEKFDDMADQLLLDKIDDQSKDAQWANP